MHILILLRQSHRVGHCGGLAQVEPGSVGSVLSIVTAVQKVAGAEIVEVGRFVMVQDLAHSDGFFHQKLTRRNESSRHVELRVATWDLESWLQQHESTKGCDHAVCAHILLQELDLMLEPLAA